MSNEDLEFLAEILEKSHWLFYGDWEDYFDTFLKEIFGHELKEWGFEEVEMKSPEWAVAYWQLISELCALNLVEYGTSPRGAWLTEKGDRFKKLVLENEEVIEKAEDYVHKRYNS